MKIASILLVLALATPALAQPFPENLRKEWEFLGAKTGWMFRGFQELEFRPGLDEGKSGELPAFVWTKGGPEIVAILPLPQVGFGLCLRRAKMTDMTLEQVARLNLTLQMIDLSGTAITGTGLRHLQTNRGLYAIDLRDSKLNDAGVKDLPNFEGLHTLYVSGTKLTDLGMKDLSAVKNLHLLNLERTAITDDGLKELARLNKLELLYLHGTKITDAGLKSLTGFKLKRLTIPDQANTDLGLKHYLAALEKPPADLSLSNWKISNAGLKEIAGLTVNTLSLNRTKISDAGLKE